MRKPRSYAEVYNDLDGEIVNLFQVLRSELACRLLYELELTPFSRDEFNQAYEPTCEPTEQARRTVIKAYMGFGSAAVTQKSPTLPGAGFRATTGFRANSNQSGTTPAKDWANFPECLKAVIERLKGVVIENRDAMQVMAQHDGTETLHYVDPPYVHSTRAISKHRVPQSYRFELTDQQHVELCEFLKTLKGFVVLSGYENEIYGRSLSGWTKVHKDAHADGARDRVEVLWLSPNCSLTQMSLSMEVAP